MTKMPGEYKYKKKICCLGSVSGLLVLSYLAFFGMTIWNTLNYQRSEKQISAITADLSRMEFVYLSKQAEINPTLAASLGFIEPSNIVIARQSLASVAVLSREGVK
jgi:hypothetical protein